MVDLVEIIIQVKIVVQVVEIKTHHMQDSLVVMVETQYLVHHLLTL